MHLDQFYDCCSVKILIKFSLLSILCPAISTVLAYLCSNPDMQKLREVKWKLNYYVPICYENCLGIFVEAIFALHVVT